LLEEATEEKMRWCYTALLYKKFVTTAEERHLCPV
jgi:hypothetical protein